MKIYESSQLPDEIIQTIEDFAEKVLDVIEVLNPGIAAGVLQLCLNSYINKMPYEEKALVVDSICDAMKKTLEMNHDKINKS